MPAPILYESGMSTEDNPYLASLKAVTKVRAFKDFGSYQGDWLAYLENGSWVRGSYGSCSHCDAYQAEFDTKEPTKASLKKFAKQYLDEPYTTRSLLKVLIEDWDSEEQIRFVIDTIENADKDLCRMLLREIEEKKKEIEKLESAIAYEKSKNEDLQRNMTKWHTKYAEVVLEREKEKHGEKW